MPKLITENPISTRVHPLLATHQDAELDNNLVISDHLMVIGRVSLDSEQQMNILSLNTLSEDISGIIESINKQNIDVIFLQKLVQKSLTLY